MDKVKPEPYKYIRCGLPGSDEPMFGTGDLALCLSGKEDPEDPEVKRIETFLNRCAKADVTRYAPLFEEDKRLTRSYFVWMYARPTPTADEFLEFYRKVYNEDARSVSAGDSDGQVRGGDDLSS